MSNTTWNRVIAPSVDGSRFGMPTTGALGTLVGCAAAGEPFTGRHIDAATKRTQGTHVWSPPE